MTENIIPEITDPLGKYWDQPDRKNILIDDIDAMMSQKTFDQLLNYSATTPSGVYNGKMWRSVFRGKNYLRWYYADDDPQKCAIATREIIIV